MQDVYESDHEQEKSSEVAAAISEAIAQHPQKFIVVWRGLYSLELHLAATYTRPEAELLAQNLLIDNRPSRIYEVDLP
jgi:DNA/RNA-binding domain of Phe-tRNA-synthetase-like protein